MKFQNFDNNSYIKQWLKGREGGKITFDETAPTYPTDDERFQAVNCISACYPLK